MTTPPFDAALLDEYLDELDREYLSDLLRLQVELLELQRHIRETKQRVVILFEGRDTAGKGGAILRFTQHLNPRHLRIVALGKPTPVEAGEWYFQRYIRVLPTAGEIVFFDRSWYNRAVVEPVMSFCTTEQHEAFMTQVNMVERLLIEDGIRIIKFWFSIDAEEQLRRLGNRAANPLKAWKLSPVDLAATEALASLIEHGADRRKVPCRSVDAELRGLELGVQELAVAIVIVERDGVALSLDAFQMLCGSCP